MKKLIAIIISVLTLSVSIFSLSACGKKIEGDYTFVAPDGAPALAIAKFICDNEDFGTDATFDYKVVSATGINAAVTVDKADLVIIPLNAATKLYNADAKNPYQLISVVTHGNFYLMSKTTLASANDLIGKVVFVPNPGKVPDWTFKSALTSLNLDFVVSDTAVSGKVAIKYYNTPQEFKALLSMNASAIGLVSEPEVSVLKGTGVSVQLDLQEMYDAQKRSYPQAVLLAKKSLVDKYPELVEKIGDAFPSNVNWVKENPALAVNAVKGKFEASTLNPEAITSATVDGCKIYWQSALSAKTEVQNYISKIRNIDQTSANMVGDEFFFSK